MTTPTLISLSKARSIHRGALAQHQRAKTDYQRIVGEIERDTGLSADAYTRLDAATKYLEMRTESLATAEATLAVAEEAIDSTDDHAAEALAEFLTLNRASLGLYGVTITSRTRPGKAVPKDLPEICISQQENSVDHGEGLAQIRELYITVYAGYAEDLAVFNADCLRDALKSAEDFDAESISSPHNGEELEGGAWRRSFVISNFAGHLNIPRMPRTLSGAGALVAAMRFREALAFSDGSGAKIDPGSITIVKNGKTRSIQFALQDHGAYVASIEGLAKSLDQSKPFIPAFGRVTAVKYDGNGKVSMVGEVE